MVNNYTDVGKVMKYLQIFKTIPNKDSTSQETVGTGDGSETSYWLDKLGVLTASYTISIGSSTVVNTALTDATDYNLDLENSEIVLTAAGVTALASNTLWAKYHYNSAEFLDSDLYNAIEAVEEKIEFVTGQRFASDSNQYRQVSNEIIHGHYTPNDKVYDLFFNPVVPISTTVNGAYTTGGSSLTVTDGTGLPTGGATIYIGGNKVAYTARTGTTLTVPTATPSIADAAVVKGEVIELSQEPEGNSYSYTVLDPDTEYEIDYQQGRLKVLRNAYWGEIDAEDRLYPSNYKVRVTYLNAWYEEGSTPFVPEEIRDVAAMMVAKKFFLRIIARSHMLGMNEFNPELIGASDEEIARILEFYKPLNVGTSYFNKQSIS